MDTWHCSMYVWSVENLHHGFSQQGVWGSGHHLDTFNPQKSPLTAINIFLRVIFSNVLEGSVQQALLQFEPLWKGRVHYTWLQFEPIKEGMGSADLGTI